MQRSRTNPIDGHSTPTSLNKRGAIITMSPPPSSHWYMSTWNKGVMGIVYMLSKSRGYKPVHLAEKNSKNKNNLNICQQLPAKYSSCRWKVCLCVFRKNKNIFQGNVCWQDACRYKVCRWNSQPRAKNVSLLYVFFFNIVVFNFTSISILYWNWQILSGVHIGLCLFFFL